MLKQLTCVPVPQVLKDVQLYKNAEREREKGSGGRGSDGSIQSPSSAGGAIQALEGRLRHRRVRVSHVEINVKEVKHSRPRSGTLPATVGYASVQPVLPAGELPDEDRVSISWDRAPIAFPSEKCGIAFLGEECLPCGRFLQLRFGIPANNTDSKISALSNEKQG
ncbi:hypothetical protein Acr_00g0075300 [Actinidia rufa]|uniref:Uncharacterized protein n=1 Tax=Actinidia rufa TaxID=165716 RepID=A0A7J0DSM9_9ERIC|nr:hypothetical protein Acr_00g0075300 [Actinidia rufa]